MYGKFCFKLLCCPPCLFLWPSKFAEKLSFFPPMPSYDLKPIGLEKFKLIPLRRLGWYQEEWLLKEEINRSFQCDYAKTAKGNRIACMFINCCPKSKFTVLFSHGNASDIGEMAMWLYHMGSEIGCNVFVYDYSGYGRSTGKPTEANLYADITCAMHSLKNVFKTENSRIILMGQSIGSVPTIDLATRQKVAGVVLISPIASGIRTIFPCVMRSWSCDVYTNIDKVERITSPVLVMHGVEDKLVHISQGMQIYEKCRNKVDPLWVEEAGHNDVHYNIQFVERLKKFVNHDIAQTKLSKLVSNSSSLKRSVSDSYLHYHKK